MREDDMVLEALDIMAEQNQLIYTLLKAVVVLKQRNEQLEKLCKQHARAVDFYIKKLDEAERQLRSQRGRNDD